MVPEFGCMFSDLPHHPRFTVRLDATDPVPPSIDRRWRGHTQQLAGVLPEGVESRVTGVDRWKYFQGPLTSCAQQLPREDFVTAAGQNAGLQPTHLSVGVQTDYRESETQTDPYSPEYVLRPGTTPPELLLSARRPGEVEMIERARAKRSWEASLPPLDDPSQRHKRWRMMEEMEAEEWAYRDGQIQKLQDARLALLTDLLRQRDEAQEQVTDERLDHIYSKHQTDRETKLHKIHKDYIRSVRKLEAERRNMEATLKQRGFAKDSPTFAPRSCRGVFMDLNFLSIIGLSELEAGLSASVRKPRMNRPKPKDNIIKERIQPPASRVLQRLEKYEEKEEAYLRYLARKQRPVPRPVTPPSGGGDEEMELAVIHLQRLLRGRSVQCEMFEGKENNLDLIQELRTVHALQREEQELQGADRRVVIALKKQRDDHRHEASRAGVVGVELESLFDTLSKELIRLQEERRIHAFTLLAERERRLREAEESGRRQVEERKRREEEEIYRQVVQIHQETVELYLEDVILGTVEQTADQQAREEIRKRAKEINDIVYAMDESQRRLCQSWSTVSSSQRWRRSASGEEVRQVFITND
uniref:Cilia- and flagella-associated protein 91 n=1 Tax=Scophthalmus maximus TaxID=52904 RepID=A0A8D3B493_SCOMX